MLDNYGKWACLALKMILPVLIIFLWGDVACSLLSEAHFTSSVFGWDEMHVPMAFSDLLRAQQRY